MVGDRIRGSIGIGRRSVLVNRDDARISMGVLCVSLVWLH